MPSHRAYGIVARAFFVSRLVCWQAGRLMLPHQVSAPPRHMLMSGCVRLAWRVMACFVIAFCVNCPAFILSYCPPQSRGKRERQKKFADKKKPQLVGA